MASENIRPGDWVNAVRTMRFGTRRGVRAATIRAVALTLASYADYQRGDEIHPGVALLAVQSEVDYRTARTVMVILRDDLGLVELVKGGRRRGYADEYRLVMPDDLIDRIEVLDPAQTALAVERIRGKHRKVETPSTGVAGTRTGMALTFGTGVAGTRTESPQPVDKSPVRAPLVPVPDWASQDRTGTAGTPNEIRTGAALPPVRVPLCPPTDTGPTQEERPTQPQRNLRTDLTVDNRSGQDPDSQDWESTPTGDPTPPPPTYRGTARVIPLRPRTA